MSFMHLEDEYVDVRNERERVYADHASPLRVYNLKKTYKGVNGLPEVQAVKNLTIGVAEGECFGFLGRYRVEVRCIVEVRALQ